MERFPRSLSFAFAVPGLGLRVEGQWNKGSRQRLYFSDYWVLRPSTLSGGVLRGFRSVFLHPEPSNPETSLFLVREGEGFYRVPHSLLTLLHPKP